MERFQCKNENLRSGHISCKVILITQERNEEGVRRGVELVETEERYEIKDLQEK